MPGYAIYIQSEFWTSYKKSDCLLKSLPKRTKYRKNRLQSQPRVQGQI